MLLKLYYAKFEVSNLFSSKVIEEKPLTGRLDPLPLGKGRVKVGTSEKEGPKLKKKLSFSHGNLGRQFDFCPGKIEAVFLHILNPNYSFYLKCSRKYQNTPNFDIFYAS